MNKYLVGLAFAGLVLSSSQAESIEFSDSPCHRARDTVCMEPLLFYHYQSPKSEVSEARVIKEINYDRDIYRVILREGDTLQQVFSDLQIAYPTATLDNLVEENKIGKTQLVLELTKPIYPQSLTYTVLLEKSKKK